MAKKARAVKARKKQPIKAKKKQPGYFVALSIVGILVGLYLVMQGVSGSFVAPTAALVIGLFVVIKEILDIYH